VAVTFDDQQPSYATQQACEEYTENKSDYVVKVLSEKGVPGILHYKCEQSEGEGKWL